MSLSVSARAPVFTRSFTILLTGTGVEAIAMPDLTSQEITFAAKEFVRTNAVALSAAAGTKLTHSVIAKTITYLAFHHPMMLTKQPDLFKETALRYLARQASSTNAEFEEEFAGFVVPRDQRVLEKPVSHSHLYAKWKQAMTDSDPVLEMEQHL